MELGSGFLDCGYRLIPLRICDDSCRSVNETQTSSLFLVFTSNLGCWTIIVRRNNQSSFATAAEAEMRGIRPRMQVPIEGV